MAITPFIGVALIVLTLQQVNLIAGQGTGTSGSTVIFGHPLVNRTAGQNTGLGPRVWIDINQLLTGGRVVAFYAATCATSDSNQASYFVRFQIWIQGSSTNYQLLYEQRELLSNANAIVTINVPQTRNVVVQSNVRFGWTIEDALCILCSNVIQSYSTLRSNTIAGSQYTAINQSLSITEIPFPIMFSTQIQIDTQLPGATGSTGPISPQGATGYTGPAGSTGPVGPTGPLGPSGTNGIPGIAGLRGINGQTGASGSTGASGLPGGTGPAGLTGQTGATGVAGDTGSSGQRGSTGSTGGPGPAGVPGPIGSTGVQGPIGSTGNTGPIGATGNVGATGLSGNPGNPGNPGRDGSTGWTGPVGPSGQPGAIGATGSKGDKGDPGLIGPQGPPGPGAGNVVVNYCTNAGCQYTCINLGSGFQCQCQPGYQLGSDQLSCVDNNECSVNNGGCDDICTNTVGSFSCSCQSGFQLSQNNRNCKDIDECAPGAIGTATCSQVCTNVVGSYKCTCNPGYALSTNGFTCSDINECSTNNGGCDTFCNNNGGSFQCSCRSGFILAPNNFECLDINECASNGTARCNQICVNTYGSYQCIDLTFGLFQHSEISAADTDTGRAADTDLRSRTTTMASNGFVGWMIILTVVVAFLIVGVGFQQIRGRQRRRQRADDVIESDDESLESADKSDVIAMTSMSEMTDGWSKVDLDGVAKY